MSTKSVAEYLDMGVTQFYKLRKACPDFPEPVIGGDSEHVQTKKYWLRTAVDRWVEKLAKK